MTLVSDDFFALRISTDGYADEFSIGEGSDYDLDYAHLQFLVDFPGGAKAVKVSNASIDENELAYLCSQELLQWTDVDKTAVTMTQYGKDHLVSFRLAALQLAAGAKIQEIIQKEFIRAAKQNFDARLLVQRIGFGLEAAARSGIES